MIIVLSLLGIIISLLAIKIKNSNKKAFCDYNNKWNCSEVLKNKKNRLFLIPNAYWGIIFFLTIIILSILKLALLVSIASFIALIISIYLFAQMRKLKKYCVICLISYFLVLIIFLT